MAYSREPDLIDILRAELAKRQERNPSYSIRSFARCLGLGPTTISQALLRKRTLSKSSQRKVIAALKIRIELVEEISKSSEMKDL